METSEKITQLENEIKVLKNEIQAILLDIRENVLASENPFSSKPAVTSQAVNVEHPVAEVKPENKPAAPPPPPTPPVKTTPPDPPVPEHKAEVPPVKESPEAAPLHNGGNGRKKMIEPVAEDIKPVAVLDNDPPRFEAVDNLVRKQPDLVAYAGLASWVEESTRRLGRDRTQALLDISEAAGCLPPEVKAILRKLTTVKPGEDSLKLTARDYLESLVKIAALSADDKDRNAALLLILSQGDKRG
jgi:hypothetical protein